MQPVTDFLIPSKGQIEYRQLKYSCIKYLYERHHGTLSCAGHRSGESSYSCLFVLRTNE